MSPQYDEVEELRRDMLRFAEVFARREAAKLDQLEGIMDEKMYKLIIGTEGCGLFGEDHPISDRDMKILRKAYRLYRSLQRRNPNSELSHIKAIIEDMFADAAMRSRNILSISPLVPGEVERRVQRMKPQIAGEDEE